MSKQAAAKISTKPSIYQTVTDRILDSLRQGSIPWEKPWQTPTYTGGSVPRNFRTGKAYRGVNIMLLWSAPYSAPFWLTFKQAQELGGTVRKGEKGTSIVFYKQFHSKKAEEAERTEEQTDENGKRSPYMLTSYTVFNVEQCDGLKLPEILPVAQPEECALDQACEDLVNRWDNRPALQLLSQTERRAYYRPTTDSVHMPARFPTAPAMAIAPTRPFGSTGPSTRNGWTTTAPTAATAKPLSGPTTWPSPCSCSSRSTTSGRTSESTAMAGLHSGRTHSSSAGQS